MTRALRSRQSGFTLIEAMIVVVIVGILATLAAYGVTKYIQASKSSEAIQIIGSIKAAQESYRSDTMAYLDVSGNNALGTYYPVGTPGRDVHAWGATNTAIGENFARLGVTVDAPVRFVYACAAGPASLPPANHGTSLEIANWPTAATGEPWYVVSALGDLDGDNVKSAFASASFTSQIFIDNEGE